jgi:hypothetical protein
VRLRKNAKPSLTLPALISTHYLPSLTLSALNGISLPHKPEVQAKDLCVNGKWTFEEPSLALQAYKDML